jgi:glycosyltransferase involved in cell wall biosynthesis
MVTQNQLIRFLKNYKRNTLKVFYDTIPNHMVSSIEKKNLMIAFEDAKIKLVDDVLKADVYIIKAFWKEWDTIKHLKGKLPIVLHCFGVQWREGIDLERDNKKLTDIIDKVDGRVFMSNFARLLTGNYYGDDYTDSNDIVIHNSQEFNVSETPPRINGSPIKCATTAVWRDWKRLEDTIAFVLKWNELNTKHKIELHVGGTFAHKIEDPAIVYHGFVNDLGYYKDMHFYLYPSLMETFGNSAAEAIGYGLPVFTTNFGAVQEVIGNAGVALKNEPEEYLNFTKRPIMYGGGLIKADKDLMIKGFTEMINHYEGYRILAAEQAFKLSHAVIGKQWYKYLDSLLDNWKKS